MDRGATANGIPESDMTEQLTLSLFKLLLRVHSFCPVCAKLLQLSPTLCDPSKSLGFTGLTTGLSTHLELNICLDTSLVCDIQ